MSIICDHGLDPKNCPMCKKAVTNVVATVTTTPGPPVIIDMSGSQPSKPAITDPAAKNVLQLAQEYAQAQDDAATLKGVVRNLRSMLEESEKQFAAAEQTCKEKQMALFRIVSPPIEMKKMEMMTDDELLSTEES